jgi:hypothetical protein
MRKLFWVLACGIGLCASPAKSASYFVDFTGIITSDITTSTSPYTSSALPANLLGQTISGVEIFTDNSSSPITGATFQGAVQPGDTASVTLELLNNPNVFSIGSAAYATLDPTGFSSSLLVNLPGADQTQNTGVMLSLAESLGQGSIGLGSSGSAGLGRTISFELTAFSASGSVSAVPLPPAFPMFATGLLALGVFGFVTRKKANLAIA